MPTFTLIPDPTAPPFRITFRPNPNVQLIPITLLPAATVPINFQISWTTSATVITASWTAPSGNNISYTLTFNQNGSLFQTIRTINTTQATTSTLLSGATYTATLAAINTYGSSTSITSSSIVPLTASPTVTISWTSGNSYVTCSWVSLSGAVSYTVIFLENSSTFQTFPSSSGNSQNSSATLLSGATYTATVIGINTYGNSPLGTTSTSIVPLTATPTVTISWTSGNSYVTCSWGSLTGATTYTVIFLQNSSSFQTDTGVAGNSKNTSNVFTSGVACTATVMGVNTYGNSLVGTSLSSIIPLTATPTVTLSWTTGNTYISCSWTSLTGVTSYTLAFIQSGSSFETDTGVTGTSQNTSNTFTSGIACTATVIGINTYGNSPLGTSTSLIPLTAVPTVTVSWTSGNSYVTCSWGSLTGAATYTVVFIQNASAVETATGVSGTSRNSTLTITSGVSLTATVIGVNSYGNSPTGTSSSSIIPLTATSTVTLSWSSGNAYVTCSWTAVTGAITYTITFIQNSSAFQTIAYATGTSVNSAITLTPGVACTATVQAVNTYGNSPLGTSSAVIPLTAGPFLSISWASSTTYLTCMLQPLTGAYSSSYTLIFLQNGSTFQTITNVSAGSQPSSTALTSGAYYTATVMGANSFGNSPIATSVDIVVPLLTATASITLTYSAASGYMKCAWAATVGAFYYTVAFLQSGSSFQTIYNVAGTSQVSSTALTAGLTYTVTVISLNSYGNSPTGSGGNSAPAGSSMSGLSLSFSSATATMSWTAYSGVSGGYTWILYQNASNSVTGGTVNAYGTTSSTSVTATTYGPNYYYFTVFATTATGTSLVTTSSVVQSSYSSGTSILPSSIANLLMWFDASDTATVFQNTGGTTPSTNGTAVALWKDKSGGLRNAVGTTANPVYTTNVQNGLAGILFNSSTLNLPTLNLSPISIFMVGKLAVFSLNIMVSLTGGTGIYLRASGGSVAPTYTSYGIDYGAAAYRYTTATANTDLNSHVWSFTLPSSGYGIFTFDGTTGLGNGFTASQIAASSSTASFGCYSQNPTNAAMNGYLNEVIIFNTNISTTNQTIMEGYLAWKWGLQANLPSGHTYKNAAPTSGSSAPAAVTGMTISFATNIATMSWSAYTGSTGYSWLLFQATSSTSVGYLISNGTTSSSTTSATYTGLITGFYYYFAVYSTAGTNSSYGTSTASLYTAVLPTGGSVVFNTLTMSGGTVTITAASNATSYTVYISITTDITGAVYSFTTTTTGSAVAFTPSPPLIFTLSYYVVILPKNACGNGSYSYYVDAWSPTGISPTGGSITFNSIYSLTSCSITITAATNATLYTVFISTTVSTADSIYSFTTATTGSAIVFSPSLSLSTTYYAIMIAGNSYNNGTSKVSAGLATSAPTGGSITLNAISNTTSGSVIITSAPSATLYTVYISTTTSTANSVYSFTTATTGSAVAFTPSPALTVATYYAIVVPSNSFGNGAQSVSSSITTSVPTGGSVVLNSISSTTSGTLTISAATGATLYTIYISTTTSSANSVYSFTSVSSGSIGFTPSPALTIGTYYAVVVASNSFGNGTAFVSASITTSIPTGGSIVLNSITSSTSGTVTLGASTGATLYTVYISISTSITDQAYSFTSVSSGSIGFTPSPPLIATTYYAIVIASNSFGSRTALYSSSVTTTLPTGGAIVLNAISSPTSGSVTITAATGATLYTVYISTTQLYTGSVYSFTTSTTGSAVLFTAPSSTFILTTYYAIVLPSNTFGNGSYSLASSPITSSVPTGGSVVLNSIPSTTSGNLTISAATGATLYTIYISTTTDTSGSVYSFTSASAGSIGFTPSPALTLTTYYAVVIASNLFGNGTAFVSSGLTTSVPTGGSVILNSIPTTTSGTLTITAATGATLYTVYISTTTDTGGSVYSFTTPTTGSARTFTPSPALTLTTYYAVVVASNTFGNGTAFVSSGLTTSVPTGGSITLGSGLALTSGTVTITASTGATSYTIYISTTTSSANSVYSFSTSTTGSAVAFTPSPSLAYGTYYAIMLPINSFGNGSYTASSAVVLMYVLSGTLTFTPAGATGSYGPTLSQCITAYNASFGTWVQNTSFFNMTRAGYQLWTVPSTKSYTIVITGAFGYNTVGASLTFTTTLTKGHVMTLVVGQGGSNWTTACSNINSGGGGASYLYNSTTATLLAVAGGGGGSTGGAGGGTNGNPTSTSGYNGYGTYNSLGNAAGGTGGNGGSSIFSSQGASQGGGGGGYSGNGANSVAGVEGGLSFTNGATGGACAVWQGGQGGFGGGAGAGNYTGGGGGGYSGGGGGWWQTSFVCSANGGGGGGGSYCFTTLTSSGLNSAAPGSITIT